MAGHFTELAKWPAIQVSLRIDGGSDEVAEMEACGRVVQDDPAKLQKLPEQARSTSTTCGTSC
jgi:hypothetical protein